jgi:hypothetical protein
MSPNAGGGGGDAGVSANEYSYTHRAQTNFGNLTPYVTYVFNRKVLARKDSSLLRQLAVVEVTNSRRPLHCLWLVVCGCKEKLAFQFNH